MWIYIHKHHTHVHAQNWFPNKLYFQREYPNTHTNLNMTQRAATSQITPMWSHSWRLIIPTAIQDGFNKHYLQAHLSSIRVWAFSRGPTQIHVTGWSRFSLLPRSGTAGGGSLVQSGLQDTSPSQDTHRPSHHHFSGFRKMPVVAAIWQLYLPSSRTGP